jgi:hypothetical protein
MAWTPSRWTLDVYSMPDIEGMSRLIIALRDPPAVLVGMMTTLPSPPCAQALAHARLRTTSGEEITAAVRIVQSELTGRPEYRLVMAGTPFGPAPG